MIWMNDKRNHLSNGQNVRGIDHKGEAGGVNGVFNLAPSSVVIAALRKLDRVSRRLKVPVTVDSLVQNAVRNRTITDADSIGFARALVNVLADFEMQGIVRFKGELWAGTEPNLRCRVYLTHKI